MITYLENYLITWDDFQGKVRSIVFYLKTNHKRSPFAHYQAGEFCKNKKKESLKLDDFFIVFSRNLKSLKILVVVSHFLFLFWSQIVMSKETGFLKLHVHVTKVSFAETEYCENKLYPSITFPISLTFH